MLADVVKMENAIKQKDVNAIKAFMAINVNTTKNNLKVWQKVLEIISQA